MAKIYYYLFPLWGVFITLAPLQQKVLEGVCLQVFDGDTLQVAGRVIRLVGIDAPELTQRSRWGVPVGRDAAQFLTDLALHRKLRVELHTRGYYGRWLARVFILESGVDVNIQMLLHGHAFAYFFRRKPWGEFVAAQRVAQGHGRGLWRYQGVQRPWHYRRRQQKN